VESVGVLTGIGVKVGLAVVLALGATAAARYLHTLRHGWRPARGHVRVVETAALGQNRALHLVSVGKRTLFLASTPSRVVMLADVTGDENEQPAAEAEHSRRVLPRTPTDFASMLRRLLSPEIGAASPARNAAGHRQAEHLSAAALALRTRDGGRAAQ